MNNLISVDTLINAGSAARAKGEMQQAIAILREACQIFPDSIPAKLGLALAYRQAERWEDAGAIYQDVLTTVPSHLEALVENGLIQRRQGNHEAALRSFAQATALADSKHSWPWVHYAVELRRTGAVDAVFQAFDRALAIDSSHYAALMEAGTTARQMNDLERALSYFERAATQHPSMLQAHVHRGETLRALKRWEQAKAVYETILTLEPDNILAMVELGVIARHLNQRAEALDLFQKATTLAPHHVWPWVHLGVELRHAGRLGEALSAFETAIGKEPNHLAALLEAGVTARQLAKREEALSHFVKATEHHPQTLQAHIYCGEELRAMKRWGEAKSAYEYVLALAPNNVTALVELGLIARQTGDHQAAIERFRAATVAGPDAIWPRIHLAVEERARGRFDHAAASLREALALDAHHLYALIEAGITAGAAGLRDIALTHFETAYRVAPTNAQAKQSLAAELRLAGRYQEAAALFLQMSQSEGSESPRFEFEYLLTNWLEAGSEDTISALARFVKKQPHVASRWMNADTQHGQIPADPFNLGSIEYLKAAEATDERFLTNVAITDILNKCIAEGRPCSVIRAGDGEGAFLAYALSLTDPDYRTVGHRISGTVIGNQIWHTWLGENIVDIPEETVIRLERDFREAVANADIIGIPPIKGLWKARHNYISLHGLAEAHRYCTRHGNGTLSAAQLNVLLHSESDFYRHFMANAKFLGLISCHPALGSVIKDAFKIEFISEYLIPFQAGNADIFRYLPNSQRHYPEYYNELRSTLTVPFPGAVFFVAAGIFGKVYCNWIKEMGGIAIDIGAIADAFAGFNTRSSINTIYQSKPLVPV